MKLWLILLNFVHNGFAMGLYDELDDSRLWRRGTPSVPTTPSTKKECIRDMLVIWDNSASVGTNNFLDNVRPFLRKLIQNEKLNVGEDGTHMGFITFASEEKTENLLKIGSKTDKKDLLSWLNGLNYERDLIGDYTYTGKAFELASTEFRLRSPLNHRKDIKDVALLFTDGEPRANKKAGTREQYEMANKYSAELMARNVTIVALAVGREADKPEFAKNIASWSNHMFTSAFNELEKVLTRIVNESCNDPVGCSCEGEISTEQYTRPGEDTILLPWDKPRLRCDQRVENETTVRPPNIKNPHRFGRGKQNITFNFKYKDNDKKWESVECLFRVNVGACECPSTQTIKAELQPRKTKVSVSWLEPKPGCPTTADAGNPSTTSGDFSVGRHKLVYKYKHSTEFQTFYMECVVNIIVTGNFCGTKPYDSAKNVCCCGKAHPEKRAHRCCGTKYYDPVRMICCQDGSLLSGEGHCPL
ncbi:uncharacterized protein LOC114534576 isoform X2 [Dendronephthya gigantea]|uniref:uncharacterized protein LOC114534576 isoform X2 n=1 Tax=Dendronephthya gigantea TaxID=151771 RepID=UPI00106B22A9|nr:uncharacterized protein LOC114534576 isoform X2 [Dendronephthya gigantea]